jgi:SAM-dependent methyltransferase
MRNLETRVGDEGFRLGEVDRPAQSIHKVFSMALECGPVDMGVMAVEEKGYITIGDIGCGTGRGLVTLADDIREATQCAPEQIGGVGITRHDYSAFQDEETAAALQERGYLYKVADMTEGTGLPSDIFDVAVCYESLRYWKERADGTTDHNGVVSGLEEARRLMSPGGTLFLSAPIKQAAPGTPLDQTMRRWQQEEVVAGIAKNGMITKKTHGAVILGEVQRYYAVAFIE